MTPLLTEYLLHLFHWSWQTSAVACAALVATRVAPRTSARFRGAILGLAFWKFLLPPMLPAPTGLFSRLGVFGLVWLGGHSGLRGTGAFAFAVAAVSLHLAGIITAVARGAVRRRGLASLLLTARRSGRVRVAIVPDGVAPRVPAALGFFHPAVLLPRRVAERLAPSDRRIVLAHERRHLELAHGLTVTIEAWLGAIWWFHPLWWVLLRERRRLREERCDEDVVASLHLDPSEYASCLVRVAGICGEAASPGWLPALGDSAEGLASRVRRLGRRARRLTLAELAVAAVLYAALLPGIRPSPRLTRGGIVEISSRTGSR